MKNDRHTKVWKKYCCVWIEFFLKSLLLWHFTKKMGEWSFALFELYLIFIYFALGIWREPDWKPKPDNNQMNQQSRSTEKNAMRKKNLILEKYGWTKTLIFFGDVVFRIKTVAQSWNHVSCVLWNQIGRRPRTKRPLMQAKKIQPSGTFDTPSRRCGAPQAKQPRNKSHRPQGTNPGTRRDSRRGRGLWSVGVCTPNGWQKKASRGGKEGTRDHGSQYLSDLLS